VKNRIHDRRIYRADPCDRSAGKFGILSRERSFEGLFDLADVYPKESARSLAKDDLKAFSRLPSSRSRMLFQSARSLRAARRLYRACYFLFFFSLSPSIPAELIKFAVTCRSRWRKIASERCNAIFIIRRGRAERGYAFNGNHSMSRAVAALKREGERDAR